MLFTQRCDACENQARRLYHQYESRQTSCYYRLIAALKSGHIGGAGLDSDEEEDGVFFEDLSGQVLLDDELSQLLMFPNVLLTSHQAFLTHEALSEIAPVATLNLLNFVANHPFLDGTTL